MLRSVTLTLAFSIFILCPVPPASAQTAAAPFSDVPASYWASPYIGSIYNAGVTTGCGDGDYCPSENVTRDQMAAFIIRALYGETFTYTQTPWFSDVPATNNFFKYIQKLRDMGITTMVSTYLPSSPVTRNEMAAFLVRARQVKAGQSTSDFTYTTTPYFTDVPPTDTYFTYVQNLRDNGITTSTGTYSPGEIVSRDQMAAFIARAFLANNVLPVTVNGALCDPTISQGYINDPCVSVTVCTPGTSTCQTINSILLDTGSYGLRIFKQALGNVVPSAVRIGTGSLAECVQFADGSSDWGPVKMASVILGNEPAVNIPIQVIDYTFPSIDAAASVCSNPDQTPLAAGFNGILGVGPFPQDCGLDCAMDNGNGQYYACTGTNCEGAAAGLSLQVSNPVTSLPTDNNGLIVELPYVVPGGQPSLAGIVVLGIGTMFNNTPSGVTTYHLDSYGDFITTFDNVSYSDATSAGGSFIDTGSNGLFFPAANLRSLLPDCQDASGWFCPASLENLSATIEGASGSPAGSVPFLIGNIDTITASLANNVFSDIGGDMVTFDWGLPFYFGSNIFIGFDGSSSSLGTGPYFAY